LGRAFFWKVACGKLVFFCREYCGVCVPRYPRGMHIPGAREKSACAAVGKLVEKPVGKIFRKIASPRPLHEHFTRKQGIESGNEKARKRVLFCSGFVASGSHGIRLSARACPTMEGFWSCDGDRRFFGARVLLLSGFLCGGFLKLPLELVYAGWSHERSEM